MKLYIKIVKPPIGDAPLWVREKWVGLELPVAAADPVTVETTSVFEATHVYSWIEYFKAKLTGKLRPATGYVVEVDVAVAILDQSSPEAAAWWKENTPHLFGWTFIFDTPACEPIRSH